MNDRRSTSAALGLALLALSATAADLHVDPAKGDDASDGTHPFRTITAALKAAKPGDTVHLTPANEPYRQMADFYGLAGGEEGRPITLDGHGVTLTGAEPCPAEGWMPYRDGALARRDITNCSGMIARGRMLTLTRNADVLQPGELCYDPVLFKRLFLRPPEGRKAAELAVEVTMPDGTTRAIEPAKWQPGGVGATLRCDLGAPPASARIDGKDAPLIRARDRLPEDGWTLDEGALYYRPPAGKAVTNMALACITRANGVQMNGETKHVVVKNLNVRHVSNDGFNIHGHVTHARFENCNAIHCGDEGFSAHDACETVLDGAMYGDCDNGIANVNTAGFSVTRDVRIVRSRAVGYLLEHKGTAEHVLENSVLIDNPCQLSVGNVVVSNVLIGSIQGAGSLTTQAIACGGRTVLRHVTAVGNTHLLRTGAGGDVRIEDCLFLGGQAGIHVRADNPLDILRLSNVRFGEGMTMEWGAKWPWKTQPLAEWLAEADRTGAATNAAVIETKASWRSGPKGFGCSPSLMPICYEGTELP